MSLASASSAVPSYGAAVVPPTPPPSALRPPTATLTTRLSTWCRTCGNRGLTAAFAELTAVDAAERRVVARRQQQLNATHAYEVRDAATGGWVSAAGGFASNSISTAKFTWWNFVPKSIVLQFQRLANIYFAIQCLIMVGGWSDAPWNDPKPLYISSINPFTTTSVLVAMLFVTGLVQLVEDVARRTQDRKVNGRRAQVIVGGAIERRAWSELEAGDLVRLESGGDYAALPADVVLITSSKPSGVAFIETSGIDGETSLKKMRPGGKSGLKLSNELSAQSDGDDIDEGAGRGDSDAGWERVLTRVCAIDAVSVTHETPNKDVERFSGTLIAGRHTINLEGGAGGQLLLRGSSLRQTAWALGIVVFCGDDTKVRRNARDPATKYSSIEKGES